MPAFCNDLDAKRFVAARQKLFAENKGRAGEEYEDRDGQDQSAADNPMGWLQARQEATAQVGQNEKHHDEGEERDRAPEHHPPERCEIGGAGTGGIKRRQLAAATR